LDLGVDNQKANAKIDAANKAREAEDARKKAEEEAANAARLKNEFQLAVAQGDKFLSTKSFAEAISAYNRALETGVDNAKATDLIAKAEKAKAEEEERLRLEDLARRKNLFDKKIAEGDQYFNLKRYELALAQYSDAVTLDIDNGFAQMKADKAQAEIDAITLAKKKAAFTKNITDGDLMLTQKKYDLALDYFNRALAVDYDNNAANQRIEKAEDLKEKERRRLEELEARRKAVQEELEAKKKEAEERERIFLAKAADAREQGKRDLIARTEAQKNALAQVDQIKKYQDEKNKAAATASTDKVSRLDLAKQYPQGVTKEEIDGPNCVITKTVIVKGEVGDEYKKIAYNFGQTYYQKNGQTISETMYKAVVKD
jgi:tetratricopeptide (TPR) repeat protein